MNVSVPYGDLFYFYYNEETPLVFFAKGFPSPMGIFFISIMEKYEKKAEDVAFPSPMGIFFISIIYLYVL